MCTPTRLLHVKGRSVASDVAELSGSPKVGTHPNSVARERERGGGRWGRMGTRADIAPKRWHRCGFGGPAAGLRQLGLLCFEHRAQITVQPALDPPREPLSSHALVLCIAPQVDVVVSRLIPSGMLLVRSPCRGVRERWVPIRQTRPACVGCWVPIGDWSRG